MSNMLENVLVNNSEVKDNVSDISNEVKSSRSSTTSMKTKVSKFEEELKDTNNKIDDIKIQMDSNNMNTNNKIDEINVQMNINNKEMKDQLNNIFRLLEKIDISEINDKDNSEGELKNVKANVEGQLAKQDNNIKLIEENGLNISNNIYDINVHILDIDNKIDNNNELTNIKLVQMDTTFNARFDKLLEKLDSQHVKSKEEEEYQNPDRFEMELVDMKLRMLKQEEYFEAKINHQLTDHEKKLEEVIGYMGSLERKAHFEERTYANKEEILDKKFKKFLDDAKETSEYNSMCLNQMQENMDEVIAHSQQNRKDLAEFQQFIQRRVSNMEDNYNSSRDILLRVNDDIQFMKQPTLDLQIIYDKVDRLGESINKVAMDLDKYKGETKDVFRNMVHETKSEASTDASSVSLNISPIKDNSKSSILMYRKVRSCNFHGLDVRADLDTNTHQPYDSGRFSYSVNLLIYKYDDIGITFLLAKRDLFHQLYPGHYDYAASGYVLAMESDIMHSAMRVIRKELGVTVSSEFLAETFLLNWSPDQVQSDDMRKYSEGALYMVNEADFVEMYKVDLGMLHPMSENQILRCDAKPDLLQLFSNARLRELVTKRIMQKVLSDRKKEIRSPYKVKDNSFDTKKDKTGKISKNTSMETPYSKTSYRAFELSEKASKRSSSRDRCSDNGEDHSSDDDFDRRGRKSYYDKKDEEIKVLLPDDSEEYIQKLSKENGQILYVQSKIKQEELYLKDLDISSILNFLRKSLEVGKTTKKAIQLTDHISDSVIQKLEYIGDTAKDDHEINLEGSNRLGGLRQGGSQTVKNLAVYKLLGYYVKPENEQEMHKKLLTNVFPTFHIKFTNPTVIHKNFKDFLMATHIYVDRHLELVKILCLYEFLNKKKFYPANLFGKNGFKGQVDYFCAGFEDPAFSKRVLDSIDLQTRYGIHSFGEFIAEFFSILKKMNQHYGPTADFFDNILHGKKALANDTTTQRYKFRGFNKSGYKKQHVNMTMEEALLQGQHDEEDAYERELEQEASQDEDEAYDEDFEQYVDDEDKQEFIFEEEEQTQKVNAIQDNKQHSGVCYNLAFKGKCETPGCIYNHDPAVIKKFQDSRKPTGTAAKLNKPSTPFRKSPPRDSKRRA